jgi:hypothetical protein
MELCVIGYKFREFIYSLAGGNLELKLINESGKSESYSAGFILSSLETPKGVLRLFLHSDLLTEQSSSWNFVPYIDHFSKAGVARPSLL